MGTCFYELPTLAASSVLFNRTVRDGRRVLRSLCCPIGTHSKRLGPPAVEGVAMIPALMYNEDKEAIRCWGLCSDTLEFGLLSPLFGASTS